MKNKQTFLMFLAAIIVIGSCAPMPPRQPPPSEGDVMPAVPPIPVDRKPLPPNVSAPVISTLSVDQRMDMLEKELVLLRQEMNLVRPAVQELIVSQNLTAKVAQKQKAAARQKPVKKVTPSTPAKIAPKASTLTSIRTGEHKGKTRLVMDIGSKAKYSYDLDNAEKLLVIELQGVASPNQISNAVSSSPYIGAYQSQQTEAGTRVFVQLKRDVRVLYKEEIKPSGKYGYRVFFDIGA